MAAWAAVNSKHDVEPPPHVKFQPVDDLTESDPVKE